MCNQEGHSGYVLYTFGLVGHAGWFYGLLGILSFSLTLSAKRVAVAELHPTFVGLGRALVAAALAAILLTLTQQLFFTLGASALLLGEQVTPATILVAGLVAVIVALGRNARRAPVVQTVVRSRR